MVEKLRGKQRRKRNPPRKPPKRKAPDEERVPVPQSAPLDDPLKKQPKRAAAVGRKKRPRRPSGAAVNQAKNYQPRLEPRLSSFGRFAVMPEY